MKRILLFVLSLVITVLITFTASAENITLSTKLAQALLSAQLQDANGSTITATLVSSDTISLSVNPANVASINFDSADLSGITSGDFESFDVFTGLEELRIALPASFSGDFAPSFDKLSRLDVSGSTADFILSLYNAPNIVSVNAGGCSDLKAVNLALARSAATTSADSTINMSLGIKVVDKLLVTPLSSLETLDLSNNPKLDRVSYAIHSDVSYVYSGGSIAGSFDSVSHTFGWGKHNVCTVISKNTTFTADNTSYYTATGSNPASSALSGTGTEIAQYTGNNINLAPALRIINLKNSGIDSSNYISAVDISEITSLASADFSGMTSLYDLKVPSGSALKSLNLTGDTGLSVLDLSSNTGFVWPEGFNTLTSLTSFKMKERNVDSLDISPFTQLQYLDLTQNSIEKLDVRNNLLLERIIVPNNRIQSLDFSKHERIKSLDIRNNSLAAIDLSKNINIRVNNNSAGNAAITISPQTRYMTGSRSRTFSFRDLGMSSLEAARVIMDSVKGGGVAVESYDALSNTVTFKAIPSMIEYDYDSGIYYEGTTTPLCMRVRLIWDVSGRKPALTPIASAIRGKAESGAVTPVTITADSETPVTWTTSPANMPAGLSKSFTDWTLTISGEPTEAYSGVVTVTAKNANGDSDPATVSIAIESASVTPQILTPVLSVSSAKITGTVNGGAISPLTIAAKSEAPVTWSTVPDVLPAGLVKIPAEWTLIISGEPTEVYSGNITVTAENAYGKSDPATVSVEFSEAAIPPSVGAGSSGGCNSGVLSMAGLVLAFAVMLRRH